MANERMIPLLPCASIDEIRDFYLPLGFEITYLQRKPNPYLALRREDADLHYFELPGVRPEDSYSTCLIVVDDTQPLYDAFAAGLRARFGKLPLTGFPRITRPRRRRNVDGLSGFSLIDPSGNWIRVTARPQSASGADVESGSGSDGRDEEPAGPLSRAVQNAVVQADSRGDVEQGARLLDGMLSRHGAAARAVERVPAVAYLAELSVRLDRPDRARELLDSLRREKLTESEWTALSQVLDDAAELERSLLPPGA